MKSNFKIGLIFVILSIASVANAQFINGDFKYGDPNASPQVISNWTNSGTQFVPDEFIKSEDSWVDLTGTGFGNGHYIEQTINTTKGENYCIAFDLGTFFGWDLWDAGVTISIDGNPLGGRIYHNNFTNSTDTRIYWVRMRSDKIVGTGSPITVRFTGDSREVQNYGFNKGVGVIALDNVALEKYTTTGVNATHGLMEFSAFPNPANDILTIQLATGEPKDFSIVMTDLAGRTVYNEIMVYPGSPVSINTSGLSTGLYYLSLMEGSVLLENRKIVIAR